MMHLAGFYASVDQAAAYTAMAAITPEAQIFVSGNDVHVPEQAPNVIVAAAGLASGGQGNARLTAPSLRGVTRYFVDAVNGNADADAVPGSPHVLMDRRANPLPFNPREVVNCDTHADPSAARKQWVLLWFADQPPAPVTGRKIYTARATGTTTLTVGQWTAVPITFDDSMPIGNIDVVGMRVFTAGVVAARIAFVGQWNRPGVLGVQSKSNLGHDMWRHGNLGVFGTFTVDTVPQIEVLSTSADTAETFELDIAVA